MTRARLNLSLPRPRAVAAAAACLLAVSACSDSATSSADPTRPSQPSAPSPGSSASQQTSTSPKPGSTSTATATPQTVAPPEPDVGDCHDLTFQQTQAVSDDSGTVACERPHTAVTYAVEELPADVVVDGVDIGNKSVQNAANRLCEQEFADNVGGDGETLATTRLTYTYFLPGQKGFDAGAHWVRCDAVAHETDTSLAQLPDDVDGLLDDSDTAAEYEVCSQGEPGTSGSQLVMCTQEHDYSVVDALRLGSDGDAFPGTSEVRDSGRAQCKEIVGDTLDTSGGYTFTWTYPTKKDWAAGHRYGFCWIAD